MLAGAVVADRVAADELLADGDLDGVADDGDLDLAAAELVADPVAGAGEATRCRRSRPCGSPTPTTPWARRRRAGPGSLSGRGERRRPPWRAVAAGVGGDEHAPVVEVHDAAVADDLDGLTGEPHPGQVVGRREADPRRSAPTRRRAAGGCVGGVGRGALELDRRPARRLRRGGTARTGRPCRCPGGAGRGCSARPSRRAAAWASSIESKTLPVRNSWRRVLWKRSTLPVVVGDRGAVSRWRDAVLPADPVEEHLTGAGPEPAGEHLAVVGQDLRRAPRGGASPTPARHRSAAPSPGPPRAPRRRTSSGRRRRRRSSPREPSARRTPPTMSICHSSIDRDRSQRL